MDVSKVLLMVFVTFMFVVLFMPMVKEIANHVGAIDIPNDRKVHKKPMPRLGGLGIYSGFLLGYMLFSEHTYMMNSILIGSFILIITGIIDDIKPLKPYHKLLGQIISALIVVFYGNVLLKDIGFFGFYIDFKIFAYPITILFILGCINCMNLIDGLDGLAGGISSIFFLTIGIIAFIHSKIALDFSLAISCNVFDLPSSRPYLRLKTSASLGFKVANTSLIFAFVSAASTLELTLSLSLGNKSPKVELSLSPTGESKETVSPDLIFFPQNIRIK